MMQFLLLHYGFEPPPPEDMEAWNTWFESIADSQVARGGLRGGREITQAGVVDLPFAKDALTGYTIIEVENLDAAEHMAQKCPIVTSTRVYEIQV